MTGVEGVTIARLAGVAGLSRSGVTRHFPTLRALQLETLARAFDAFAHAVPLPVASRPAGVERLLAVCERWTAYLSHTAFPGVALLATAAASPGGPDRVVVEAVRVRIDRWLELLADDVRTAVELGQLTPAADPEALAYELHALAMAADQSRRMLGDERAPARSLALMRAAVLAHAPGAAAP